MARLRRDAENDLWPDPAGMIDLPRSDPEFRLLKAAVLRVRAGAAHTAKAYMLPKRDGLTRPGHVMRVPERVYLQALVDTFLYSVQPRLEAPTVVFGYRPQGPRNSAKPFGGAMRPTTTSQVLTTS